MGIYWGDQQPACRSQCQFNYCFAVTEIIHWNGCDWLRLASLSPCVVETVTLGLWLKRKKKKKKKAHPPHCWLNPFCGAESAVVTVLSCAKRFSRRTTAVSAFNCAGTSWSLIHPLLQRKTSDLVWDWAAVPLSPQSPLKTQGTDQSSLKLWPT